MPGYRRWIVLLPLVPLAVWLGATSGAFRQPIQTMCSDLRPHLPVILLLVCFSLNPIVTPQNALASDQRSLICADCPIEESGCEESGDDEIWTTTSASVQSSFREQHTPLTLPIHEDHISTELHRPPIY